MRGSVRKLIAVLLFHALWPAFALAQQSPAGVVTTLHGLATVARTAVPQEVPLKFKDDVFYKDRISTKESSIVRVLLGGKALVTVRELSVLTITEEPGRATVDVESGKIALAVARKLMRPGEVIEIRTPNAVAAVRGTVVIVEVFRATAAAQLGPVAWTTIVSAVSDIVDVIAGGVSLEVPAGNSTNILGSQPPGPLYPNPPTIFQGLSASPQFSKNADSGHEVGKAEALATALTGGLPVSPLPSPPPPPQPSTSDVCVQCAPITQAVQSSTSPPPPPLGTLSKTGFTLEQNFGGVVSALGCDDCSTIIQFGFSFPFLGRSFTTAEVSSNGYLIPGNTVVSSDFQICCDFTPTVSKFLAGPNRIAVAWYDLLPLVTRTFGPTFDSGTINYNTFPGRAVITWNNVAEFPNSSPGNTFQVQLLSNGTIIFLYPTVSPPRSHNSIIGVTPGGGVPDPGPVTFSTLVTTFNSGTVGTVYHLFGNGEFIAQGSVIIGQPNGLGGWNVVDPPMTGFSLFSVANGGRVTLSSPLLDNPSTPQTILGAVAQIDRGQLIVPGSTGPLVSLTGGPHSLAILPGTSMFDLTGSATAPQVVEGNTLTLGTDQPIQGDSGGAPAPLSVPLLQTSGASLGTERAVRLDTALLEASAPLLNLTVGSSLTSASDLVKLAQNAKLIGYLPSDALVKLNASTLTVNSGSLFNVAGGSLLSVTGNLVSLANGSTLNILSGSLLSVSGGSVFTLTGGSLGVFGSGTNSLNITNTSPLCSGCTLTTSIPNLGGYPVLLGSGALASNVTVASGFTPFRGLSAANTVKVSGASGAVLTVSGPTSKVILKP